MGIEVIAGWWSGSLALLADAGHMLTDAASLALALFAAQASRRGPDDLRTYGYGRARVLAAFVNGLALLTIAAWIVFEGIQRLREPVEVIAGPMMVVAAAGLAVNFIAYLILRHSHDINSRSALAHVLGDMLGSVAAIVAAGIILLTGWMPADPLLSIAVALLIARTGWSITRECAHTLLEGSPPGFDSVRLASSLMRGVPGLCEVHHVHAWTIGADEVYISLHVRVDNTLTPDAAIRDVQAHLFEHFGVHHVTTQVEYGACAEPQH